VTVMTWKRADMESIFDRYCAGQSIAR
jgi:hypothetical protein